jgi:hypothetical protein
MRVPLQAGTPRHSAGLRWLLPALLLVCGWGQAISYTVQVVAVSDQGQALALVRQLLLDGFPAYVTRTTTAQGDIYRVRVGGFANRAAALLYAEAMPEFPALGGPPLPTLAENIPAGVTPLEPRLLLAVTGQSLEILDWLPDAAVRVQGPAGEPDVYYLFADGILATFEALRAWPAAGAQVLRLRNLPLWPGTWREDPAAVRFAQRESLLAFMSERFGVPLARLEAAVLEGNDLPPRLLVLERFDPWRNPEAGSLLAVAVNPADADAGPVEFAGEAPDLQEPITLFAATPETQVAVALQGDGWQLSADGNFLLQVLPGGDRGWRVAVGLPLWTDGQRVLARSGTTLLLYDFVER